MRSPADVVGGSWALLPRDRRQAIVENDDVALGNARASYERSKQLYAQKFISQAALDQAESAYKAAQARVSALLAGAGAAATERSFATLVAPYSGVVSARHVELGEMATPGRPIMTGFDPSTLTVKAGQTVRIEFSSTDTAFHSDGGGWHQFASEELGLDFKVGPLSEQLVSFTVDKPGTYGFYCNVCCAGKANPYMNGRLIVEA